MKVTKSVTKEIAETEVVETVCNFCCKRNTDEFDDISSFTIQFGYGSKHDGDTWQLDICDKCADKLHKQLELKPVTTNRY